MRLGWITLSLFFAVSCTNRSEKAISIAYPSLGAIMNTHLGLIFEKTDILKKHGLNASIASMGTGKELKVAMVSGKADVILTTETNFPVLLGEGFDAVAINSLGSAGRIGLLVKNGKFEKLSDLKDKTIGTIFGTSIHEPAVKWSQEVGAKLINMDSIAAMQAALESGNVDAIVSWDPYLTNSLEKNQVKILAESSFDLIAVASADFTKKNPDQIQKFNESLKEAVEYLRNNRDEINKQFAQTSNIDADLIHKASLKNEYYVKDKADWKIEINKAFEDRLQSSGDFLFREKIIRQKPEVQNHIWKNPS